MKGKDLAFLAGGALLVYMLIPKKAAEAAPGVPIISIPTAGAPPLDIGGLFGGIASIFGAMPTQIMPEIIIPGLGEQGPSEWDIFQMFERFTEQWDPSLTEGDLETAVQDALNKFLPREEQQPPPDGAPSLIPEIPDWLKNLLAGQNGAAPGPALSIAEQIVQGVAGRGFFDVMGELIGTRVSGVQAELIDMAAFFTGQHRPYGEYLETKALTEAQFDIAGVDEIGSIEDIRRLQLAGEITGIREHFGYVDPEDIPPIGSPDYLWYMSGKPAPISKREEAAPVRYGWEQYVR